MTMVKNTVHPAGMAVFSELLIRSTLELGVSFEVARQPIHFYEFPIENLHAVETLGVDYDIAVVFRKTLNDTYLAEEQHVSHVGKNVSFSYVTPFDNASAFYGTTFDITKDGGLYTMTISIDNEGAITIISGATMPFGYYVSIGGTTFEHISGDDIVTSSDTASIQAGKGLTETVASGDSIPYMVITKLINETVIATETINSIYSTQPIPNDEPTVTDVLETSFTKTLIDGVSVSDNNSLLVNKAPSDSLPNGVNENIEIIEPGKAAQSTLHTMEDTHSSISKNLVEISTASEIGNINIQEYWSYDYTSGAYEAGDYVGSNNSI